MTEPAQETCRGCGCAIDPTTCMCGEPVEGGHHDWHYPVPLGCQCHLTPLDEGFDTIEEDPQQ